MPPVRASCSSACGLPALFQLTVWTTTHSFTFQKETFDDTTVGIANANASVNSDAVRSFGLGLLDWQMIFGVSHRKDPATSKAAVVIAKAGLGVVRLVITDLEIA